LEVILALALCTLVLVSVGIGVDVYLRSLSKGRTEVEQAQLARALLQRIADDLRSAVAFDPELAEKLGTESGSSGGSSEGSSDASSDESSGQDEGSGTGGGGSSDESGTDESGTGESGAGTEDGTDSSSTFGADESSDSLSAGFASLVPGLFGTATELQVDVSRLPRIDPAQLALEAADPTLMVSRPSDVKTVTYYVPTDASVAAAQAMGTGSGSVGLVRREMDRAVTCYAAQQGLFEDLEQASEVIAPEVIRIEFSYFDGLQWYDTWDSEAQGGLPMAIRIDIALRREGEDEQALPPSATVMDLQMDGYPVYRLAVRLPTGRVTSLDGTTAGMEDLLGDETSGQTSDSSSSQQGSQDSSSQAGGGGSSSGGGGGGSSSGGGGGSSSRGGGGGGSSSRGGGGSSSGGGGGSSSGGGGGGSSSRGGGGGSSSDDDSRNR
jgi:hypothetical protein